MLHTRYWCCWFHHLLQITMQDVLTGVWSKVKDSRGAPLTAEVVSAYFEALVPGSLSQLCDVAQSM
jgi:hypothetical protein